MANNFLAVPRAKNRRRRRKTWNKVLCNVSTCFQIQKSLAPFYKYGRKTRVEWRVSKENTWFEVSFSYSELNTKYNGVRQTIKYILIMTI